MRTLPRIVGVVSIVALLWGAPGAADALRPWNQEEVTALARRLSTATTDARNAARRDPSTVGARDRRTLRYLDALRRLETGALQLATALEKGQGREQTEGIALRVRNFARDAQQHGSGLPQAGRTAQAMAPAGELMAELATYYFADGG